MANKYSRSVLKPMASQYVDDQSVNVAKILRERYDKGLEKKIAPRKRCVACVGF